MKNYWPLLVFCVFYLSSANAGPEDVQRIEELIEIPESIQKLEMNVQEQSCDTNEVKLIRSKLKKAIEEYRNVAKDVRKKYQGWIDTEHKAQKVRLAIQNREKAAYGKIVANYAQLGFYEVKGYFLSPKGSKGAVAEWNDSIQLDLMKMRVDNAQWLLQRKIKESPASSNLPK